MKRTETNEGRPGLRQIANSPVVPGGLPIKADAATICSGGVARAPGANGDESCAQRWIEKVKDQLK